MMTPELEKAMGRYKEGGMVILVDDPNRENEGDLVLAGQFATAKAINFMSRYGRGLVCLALDQKDVKRLGLYPMAQRNTSPLQTNFMVSIEAREGVTTGISAQDRATTIQTAVNPQSGPHSLVTPGHVFPLLAKKGGVLVRAGQTEGSVDLSRLCGLHPSAVICEIMNDDGTMARMPELERFSKQHDIPIVTVADLISYRLSSETLVEEISSARLPTSYGGEFTIKVFENLLRKEHHIALVKGDLTAESAPLVRVHSECITGDVFGSSRCDCGSQLQAAMKQIAESGSGVLLYLYQEGRGIGIANKVKAYAYQDKGLDTVEANHRLGFRADLREYGVGAQILRSLGISKMRLLTNNPRKIKGLEGYGLEIVDRVPIQTEVTKDNQFYLETKKDKLGHLLQFERAEPDTDSGVVDICARQVPKAKDI